jgi:hypothetical protein
MDCWEEGLKRGPMPLVLAELVEVESRRRGPKVGWLSRFWASVSKGADDECWLWTGATNHCGYGTISVRFMGVKKRQWLVHRISYLLAYGSISDGMNVLHKCDVVNCVSPLHLFLGTNADNMQDSARKHRNHIPFGSLNANSKLNDEKVRSMRSIYANGEVTLKQVGVQFGISIASAFNAINGKTWRRVQ